MQRPGRSNFSFVPDELVALVRAHPKRWRMRLEMLAP